MILANEKAAFAKAMAAVVTLPDNISNQLMEFLRRIYPLKQVLVNILRKNQLKISVSRFALKAK